MSKPYEEQLIDLCATGTHINNPYHNLDHCVAVYKMCQRIYQEERDGEVPVSLAWASIFHDYNHSGGKTDDPTNIEAARNGVTEFFLASVINGFDTETLSSDELIFHGYLLRRIHELIECTVFDKGGFLVTPTTFEAKALRDADLSAIYLPTEQAVKALRGLYQEMLITTPDLTMETFCDRNRIFLTRAKWFTLTCQELAETELRDRMDSVFPILLEDSKV